MLFSLCGGWLSDLSPVLYGIALFSINLFVAYVAWLRQSLSTSGAAAATLVGMLTLSFLDGVDG
jgi:uncharacterized membrane protein